MTTLLLLLLVQLACDTGPKDIPTQSEVCAHLADYEGEPDTLVLTCPGADYTCWDEPVLQTTMAQVEKTTDWSGSFRDGSCSMKIVVQKGFSCAEADSGSQSDIEFDKIEYTCGEDLYY